MKLPFIVRLAIVILITLAISSVAPEAVNYILVLILIGAVLSNVPAFSGLAAIFGTLDK